MADGLRNNNRFTLKNASSLASKGAKIKYVAVFMRTSALVITYRSPVKIDKFEDLRGVSVVHGANDAPSQVLSFIRENEQDKVFAVFNFSGREQRVTMLEGSFHGQYREFFSHEQVSLGAADAIFELAPWTCKVYVREIR